MSYLLISTSLGAHPLHIPNLQDRHARAYGLLDLRGAQCRVQLHPRAAAKPWDFPMGKQRLSRGWSSLPFIFPFKMMSSLGFPCLDKLGFGKLEVWSEEHMLSWEGEHFNNSFGIEHRLRLKKRRRHGHCWGSMSDFRQLQMLQMLVLTYFYGQRLNLFKLALPLISCEDDPWYSLVDWWVVLNIDFSLSPLVIFHYPQLLFFTIPNGYCSLFPIFHYPQDVFHYMFWICIEVIWL